MKIDRKIISRSPKFPLVDENEFISKNTLCKKLFKIILLLVLLTSSVLTPSSPAIAKPNSYKFVVIADPHISDRENMKRDGRLIDSVKWINENLAQDINFVVVVGDIISGGDRAATKAKAILDELQVPYIPIIGDNEKENSESLHAFITLFHSHYRYLSTIFDDFEIPDEPENGSYINNLSFVHKGVRYLAPDWSTSDQHATINNSFDWFKDQVNNGATKYENTIVNENIVVFSHIPMYDFPLPGNLEYESEQLIDKDIDALQEFIKTKKDDILANFAGHIHISVDNPEPGYGVITTGSIAEDKYCVFKKGAIGIDLCSEPTPLRLVTINLNELQILLSQGQYIINGYDVRGRPISVWQPPRYALGSFRVTYSSEIISPPPTGTRLNEFLNESTLLKINNANPLRKIGVAVNDRYDAANDQSLYVGPPGVLSNDMPVNGKLRVYYQTNGRQIYELGWDEDVWHNHHITADSTWPLPAGKSMAALAVNNAPQLYYASSDGHVHHLAWYVTDQAWHYERDITAQVGGPPPVDGTLTAVTVNDNPRLYYLAGDGYVHELAWVIDTWYYRNVTVDAGGPPAIAGSALGVSTITNDDPRVYYLAEGVGGLHVHELAWRSLTHVWYHGDLTAIVVGDSSPLDRRAQGGGTTRLGVMTANRYPRVAYLAAVNGETHVVEYYWDGAEYSYKYNDITQLTSSGIAQPNPGSPLIATTVDKQGDPRLYYQGRVGNENYSHIYELGWYENRWNFRDVTGDGAGLSPNLDSLMATTAAGALPQVYYFNDRTIHQLAWNYPNNWQDMNLMTDLAWPTAIFDSPLSAIMVKERLLSTKLISDVAHGKLDFYEDGSFIYSPEAGFTGRDSFTYVASTDFTESALATVALDVTGECFPVNNNLIRNFCFDDGGTEWRFYHNDESAKAGAFTLSVDKPFAGTAAAMITLRASGSNVQFYQTDLALVPKTTYELAFAAYADGGEDMRVFLHQHGAPYTNYGLRANVVPLEPHWKYFTYTFTTPDRLVMNDARLRFWFAPYAQAGTVYHIDRVLLRKTSDIYGPVEPLVASTLDEDFERELLAGAEVPDEPAIEEQLHLYLPLVANE